MVSNILVDFIIKGSITLLHIFHRTIKYTHIFPGNVSANLGINLTSFLLILLNSGTFQFLTSTRAPYI